MKSGAKVKKVQLKISQKNESALIGIVSSEPDYKLSLSINRKVRLALKNVPAVIISDEPGNEHSFSRFTDNSSSQDLVYLLISNRSGKHFLLKKLKNIDYLFVIQNSENEAVLKKIAAGFREIDSITAIFMIDPASVREKNLQYVI